MAFSPTQSAGENSVFIYKASQIRAESCCPREPSCRAILHGDLSGKDLFPRLILNLADDIEVAKADAHGVRGWCLVQQLLDGDFKARILFVVALRFRQLVCGLRDGQIACFLVPESLGFWLGDKVEELCDSLVLGLRFAIEYPQRGPPMIEFWGAPGTSG